MINTELSTWSRTLSEATDEADRKAKKEEMINCLYSILGIQNRDDPRVHVTVLIVFECIIRSKEDTVRVRCLSYEAKWRCEEEFMQKINSITGYSWAKGPRPQVETLLPDDSRVADFVDARNR